MGVGDAEAVVVAVGFVRGVGTGGVDDDRPVGVGVTDKGGVVLAAGYFSGEEVGEDGEGLVEGLALVVAVDEAFRFDQWHGHLCMVGRCGG